MCTHRLGKEENGEGRRGKRRRRLCETKSIRTNGKGVRQLHTLLTLYISVWMYIPHSSRILLVNHYLTGVLAQAYKDLCTQMFTQVQFITG